MTPADGKRAQRQRDKLLGWVEVTVKVGAAQAEVVRDFAAGLPDPEPVVDPNQLSLLAALDDALSCDTSQSSGGKEAAQASLF